MLSSLPMLNISSSSARLDSLHFFFCFIRFQFSQTLKPAKILKLNELWFVENSRWGNFFNLSKYRKFVQTKKIIDWFPHLHITRKKAFFLHFPMFQENDIKKWKRLEMLKLNSGEVFFVFGSALARWICWISSISALNVIDRGHLQVVVYATHNSRAFAKLIKFITWFFGC